MPTLAQPSSCPHRSARRPSSSRIAALANGIAISSQKVAWNPVTVLVPVAARSSADVLVPGSSNACICPSVLQQVRVVDARGTPAPEDRHDDGKTDHDFSGGHDHDEERHDLTIEVAVDA